MTHLYLGVGSRGLQG